MLSMMYDNIVIRFTIVPDHVRLALSSMQHGTRNPSSYLFDNYSSIGETMSPSQSPRRSSRLLGRLGVLRLLAMIVAACALVSLTGAAPAAAATFHVATKAHGFMLKGGPGHPQPVFSGTWKQDNRTGPCGAFGKSTPDSSGFILITGTHRDSTDIKSKMLDYMTNKLSNTTSNELAGILNLASWHVQNEAAFQQYYPWAVKTGVISAARVRAVTLLIGEAQQAASGYKLSVKADDSGVGHIGEGSLAFFTRRGAPAIGSDVIVQVTNGVIISVNGHPGNRGVTTKLGVHFQYKATRLGKDFPVSFKAVAYTPSTRQILKSNAQPGHQFIFTGGFRDVYVATYSYVIVPGDVTTATACDSDCNGMSTVSFSKCIEKGSNAAKYEKFVGTTLVATLNVASGTCADTTARLADASIITGTLCNTGTTVGGPCVSNVVKLPGSFEVVCPIIKITICYCSSSNPSIKFLVPATIAGGITNTRSGTGYVTVGTNATQSFALVNGVEKTIDLGALAPGTVVTFGFIAHHDADPASPEVFRKEWRSIPNA